MNTEKLLLICCVLSGISIICSLSAISIMAIILRKVSSPLSSASLSPQAQAAISKIYGAVPEKITGTTPGSHLGRLFIIKEFGPADYWSGKPFPFNPNQVFKLTKISNENICGVLELPYLRPIPVGHGVHDKIFYFAAGITIMFVKEKK